MNLRSLAWVALAGCGNHSAHRYDPPAPTPAATPAPADCKAATDELDKFLTTMDHEGSMVDLSKTSPPMRRDLQTRELEYAPVLDVRTSGIFFQGDELAPAALAAKLKAMKHKMQEDFELGRYPKRHPPDLRYMIVVADEHATWGSVASAVEVARQSEFDHLAFVFRRPTATQPPPRTHVDDEIEKLMAATEGGNKATALASYISPKVAVCPPLVQVFGEVGAAETGDTAAYLLSKTAPAIAACNCALDPAEARSIMWQTAGNPKPIAVLRVELDKKAPAVSAPADKSWGEASAKLTPDMTKISLTATPK